MRIFRGKNVGALRRTAAALLIAWAALCIPSCSSGRNTIAILWTDTPDFAFYAKYFNASQDRYKVEVFHHDFPAKRLRDSREHPDIIVASWLHGASARNSFRSLDAYINGDNQIDYAFYASLLAKGNINGRQYLLPVSFNAPLAVFASGHSQRLSSSLTIGLGEMRELGRDFNARTGNAFTRMGFSPKWDDNFLFVAATLFGVSFREVPSPTGASLAWDSLAIEQAMNFVHEWTSEANSGIQATDNFTFRFFNLPPANMVLTERVLFAYMDSARFFTLSENQRNGLDFRWLAENDTIPLAEGAVHLALPRGGTAPRAADAFVRWFFRADTQRSLLERSHKFRQMETSFGIAGGFSALRPVTEQVFPQFYPDMLGHMPPEDFLSPAGILPNDWAAIKERVVLPYLNERALRPDGSGMIPLETRLADWARLNRF